MAGDYAGPRGGLHTTEKRKIFENPSPQSTIILGKLPHLLVMLHKFENNKFI
jgi:hypothetical protein